MGNICGGASGQALDKDGKPLTKVTRTKGTPKAAAGGTPAAAIPPPATGEAAGGTQPQPAQATEVTPSAEGATAPAAAASVVPAAPSGDSGVKKLKVYIIFYSTLGHIEKLAREYKTALESVGDVEAHLFRVPETMTSEQLDAAFGAAPPPPPEDIPIIDVTQLPSADAFVFGFPTWFGMMAGQMKTFFDATGALWQAGALHGKPASIFTSAATQCGGHETTLLTSVTQLAHHGMIFVPTGYAAGAAMFGIQDAKGGSPWGASTIAGLDGSRQPSEVELEALRVQAKHFGAIAKKLAA
ncbi:hypothetical protein HYH02_005622 [Chlamydomonas schloesseri]|uniref:NAD(P)H dehydrogenase (quinone) n=1 Tax=Chlamydomonas schloesseri TaxID=2026947 RepID=A0A835WLJ6_9CHLO|nr:hypothetical protein HYH02_005622 [Chlamydomonas schloesseri]|eukprot:KAG2449478.1 hypothetical protein HYH02_005622 [Chlamydomonas schloesseri]